MLFKFIKNACFEPQSQELKWSRIFWTFGGLGKVHEEQRWRSSKWNGISWYQTFWTLWYLEKLMYLWQHQKTKNELALDYYKLVNKNSSIFDVLLLYSFFPFLLIVIKMCTYILNRLCLIFFSLVRTLLNEKAKWNHLNIKTLFWVCMLNF